MTRFQIYRDAPDAEIVDLTGEEVESASARTGTEQLDVMYLLRHALGTGLIQSGYLDQDPETGTIDALQWQPCPGCPSAPDPCACSGIPYLSDEVWEAADRFGTLTQALAAAEARGYRKAIDRLRDDENRRNSATWAAFQRAADYLEAEASR